MLRQPHSRYADQQRRHRQQRLRLLRRFKQFKGCARCGYNDDYHALDFHHVDGVGDRQAHKRLRNGSRATVKCELAKCEVLCANCHAIETRS